MKGNICDTSEFINIEYLVFPQMVKLLSWVLLSWLLFSFEIQGDGNTKGVRNHANDIRLIESS